MGKSLFNQAIILCKQGDIVGAMALYKEAERLCRERGDVRGLSISLANQAELLFEKMNRPREALPLAVEAHRLAAEHGYAALSEQFKAILDRVLSRLTEADDS